jgi:hypothetical protein
MFGLGATEVLILGILLLGAMMAAVFIFARRG